MLDKFYYLNNYGETLYFGKEGIFAFYNDLRDYQWGYESVNEKITGFTRGIITKKLPVLFLSASGQQTRQARNRAYEIIEKDVLANKKGKLYCNGYYMECWLIGTSNSEYLNSESYLKTEFAVVTDKPEWVKATTLSFIPTTQAAGEYDVDFDCDFPFDLQAVSYATNTLINPFAFASQFILNIYGACENPQITIGDYTYLFNCELSAGERLEVNTLTKKIYKYDLQGNVENYFNCRNKKQTVFAAIPSGNKQVQWNNEFSFDLMLLQQRSEPEWSYTAKSVSDIADIEVVDSRYYLIDTNCEYIMDNYNEPISVQSAAGD